MTEKRHSGVPGGGGGAEVKSGTVSVPDATNVSVTFASAFNSIPAVVVSFEGAEEVFAPGVVGQPTVSSFVVFHEAGPTKTVHWIATSAGNP